jgi:hypothetical protein
VITGARALRLIAVLAAGCGHVAARAARGWRTACALVAPQAGWRTCDVGGVRLRLPPGWGDPEREGSGALVVHNRARRFRIDGDAVWYSSAIELRILDGEGHAPRNAEAMTTTRRVLTCADRRVTVELAVANGVGDRQREIAERVLRSIRPSGGPGWVKGGNRIQSN